MAVVDQEPTTKPLDKDNSSAGNLWEARTFCRFAFEGSSIIVT
jgi:hypothetical protein